jgi:hypothetical protein
MITLKESGTIAEFFDRYDITRPSNICEVFYKTFWLSSGLFMAGTVVGLYALGLVLLFLPDYWHPLAMFSLMLTAVGGILGAAYYADEWRHGRPYRPPTEWEKNLSEAYKGFKEKYCPLITYGGKS